MGSQQELHEELLLIVPNVYYQPPESLKIDYPCIIYNQEKMEARYANNSKYANLTRYQLKAIDRKPDGTWQNGINDMPLCRHDRNYVVASLNHSVFELYY